MYDKAVNRKSSVNFNPRQTIDFLHNEEIRDEMSYELKRKIVKQFLDVSFYLFFLLIFFKKCYEMLFILLVILFSIVLIVIIKIFVSKNSHLCKLPGNFYFYFIILLI